MKGQKLPIALYSLLTHQYFVHQWKLTLLLVHSKAQFLTAFDDTNQYGIGPGVLTSVLGHTIQVERGNASVTDQHDERVGPECAIVPAVCAVLAFSACALRMLAQSSQDARAEKGRDQGQYCYARLTFHSQ